MDKLKMAQDYIIAEVRRVGICSIDEDKIMDSWKVADAMQAEADKRSKEEAEQKRKEIREILNDAKTFIEREGQHLDDVGEWQPDWSQAPDWANYWVMNHNGICYWTESQPVRKWNKYAIIKNEQAPTFNYQGIWQESLRERTHGF